MKCKECGREMVKVAVTGEWFCSSCTRCPVCHRKATPINPTYGVMPCGLCQERLRGKPLPGGPGSWSDDKLFEYAATPAWKHLGLKPNEREKQEERFIKSKGWGYRDLQRARHLGGTFNNGELVKNLLDGKVPNAHQAAYHRE